MKLIPSSYLTKYLNAQSAKNLSQNKVYILKIISFTRKTTRQQEPY